MKPKRTAELQRNQLEARLKPLRKLGVLPRPKSWIRTIREALGMPLNVLAKRLKVSSPTVRGYERAEEMGSISVGTLGKVAAALECEVQILFIPRKPIPQLIQDQAIKAATRIVNRATLHMSLENQGTSSSFQQQQIKTVAEELERTFGRSLWEQDS